MIKTLIASASEKAVAEGEASAKMVLYQYAETCLIQALFELRRHSPEVAVVIGDAEQAVRYLRRLVGQGAGPS